MTETNQTLLGASLAKTKPDKLTPQEYDILIKACVPAVSSDSGACDGKFWSWQCSLGLIFSYNESSQEGTQ